MWFEKISIPPPMDSQWKFLGGGGLKGKNFQGVWGFWNVHREENNNQQNYGINQENERQGGFCSWSNIRGLEE